jgi:hypothetical protein
VRLHPCAPRRIFAAAFALGLPRAASAHGFGQRFDLPLPLWLWITGAGATIVLTFVVMALFFRETRDSDRYPTVELPSVLASPVIVHILRMFAVVLFVVSLAAGFVGSEDPYSNLITPMVWVIWWVGVAFTSALIGDVWAVIDPLRTMFRAAERLYTRATGGRTLARALIAPRWLGVWPAAFAFLAFAWCELIWADKDIPARLATVIAAYSVYTWLGMFLFGREEWSARGEAFAIAFGVLARFSPVEVCAAGLRLRPYGAGLRTTQPVSWSFMVFVILMLSTVTYDGFQETALMQRIDTFAQSRHALATLLFEWSEWGFDESRVTRTFMLVAFAAAFVAIFQATSWLMLRWTEAIAGRANRPSGLTASIAARSFVLTLVPIAVAYHLSHYFSLLLTAGQFAIPLASDPFGWGWNLFGSAGYKVNLAVVSPYVFWYGAVALIVVGHVIAVYLAHVASLRLFGSARAALASQVPMLALMVGYTTLSLWILAQPIVG